MIDFARMAPSDFTFHYRGWVPSIERKVLILRVENLELAQTHGQRGRWVIVELALAHFFP